MYIHNVQLTVTT